MSSDISDLFQMSSDAARTRAKIRVSFLFQMSSDTGLRPKWSFFSKSTEKVYTLARGTFSRSAGPARAFESFERPVAWRLKLRAQWPARPMHGHQNMCGRPKTLPLMRWPFRSARFRGPPGRRVDSKSSPAAVSAQRIVF